MRVSVLALTCISGLYSQAQCDRRAELDDKERTAVIAASQGTRESVSVELLADEACFRRVVEAVRRLGSQERFLDAKVGYAWFMVPKANLLDILDLAGVAEVWTATNDIEYTSWDPPQPPGPTAPMPHFTIPFPSVASVLPGDGPYFPAQESGLTDLWKGHPTADGRGVRVAFFDDGVDLLHPALSRALTAEGREVPKVSDFLTLSQPDEAAGWVRFDSPIKTVKGKFDARGRTWTAPYEGAFRFGIYSRRTYFGVWTPAVRGDLPPSIDVTAGVLWDEEAGRVWVDTNGDGSFLDQKPLRDYAETQDWDYFGTKDATADNRVPFGVKIDRSQARVYVSLAGASHGTFVAGTLAGNRLSGGLYDGAAPNVQLVDARGYTLNGQLATVIASLARNDVSALNRSSNFGGRSPGGGFEVDFYQRVLNRATTIYDKPISCYCYSKNALFIGDYQSAEMLRRNRQTKPPYSEAIHGAFLPASDGLMNSLLAPSAMLTGNSRYSPLFAKDKSGRTVWSGELPGSPAPDGYSIGENPSPTIPFGAGVMADLISEARRQHIPYTANRLIQAILTSSRLVKPFPTFQQGHGVIDAAGAWDQLTRMAAADDRANPELTSFIIEQGSSQERHPAEGFWSDFPEKRGAQTGQLWVTRRGGHRGSRRYALSLRGNDGTFQLLTRQLSLIQGVPAPVRFSFRVSPGQHLAFVRLLDISARVVMQEVPLFERTSVSEAIAPGVYEYRTTLSPLSADYQYVYLDPAVQAARFVMRVPYVGNGRYSGLAIPGVARGFLDNHRPSGPPLDPIHHVGPMEEVESLISNAGGGALALGKPHTYSIDWSNAGQIEYATPYDDPVPDVPIDGSFLIQKYAVTISGDGERLVATNQLADVTGRLELYNADVETESLDSAGSHGQAILERTLPAHLAQ